ncbi:MAG: hypothetical protein KF813_12635 [Trueperaceae bacterium]|nr:hypothetical protein [Trueperaceae bacterium]
MRLGMRIATGTLILVLTTAGCRPLYIPLVPDSETVPAPGSRLRLATDSALTWSAAERRLELSLSFSGLSESGWLAVQWFSPAGGQAASESVWLEVGTEPDTQRSLVVFSPADLELLPGEWRAVVSWQGELLRQFRAEVPAPIE